MRRPISPARTALAEFLRTEAAGGAVLLVASVIALAWASSPLRESYADLWHVELGGTDLRHWVSDGLMTVFFLVVGLEIARELVDGELRDRRAALLPVLAAVGGMIVPAGIFLALMAGAPDGAARGWAIPTATDIAFAVGVLSLFGPRVPIGLRVMLLALAIADDIGAILVIAVGYTEQVSVGWLAVAVLALVAYAVLARRRVWWPVLLVLALGAWWATRESGVHATIAGVALGLLTPGRHSPHAETIAERLERRLHPVSVFVVLPIFALANAGIDLTALGGGLDRRIALAVLLGLVVGKPVGVLAGSWLAVRAGWARLPDGASWSQVAGIGLLAGMGFTVALFVTTLAYDSDAQVSGARLGILVGSFAAAVLGGAVVRRGSTTADQGVG